MFGDSFKRLTQGLNINLSAVKGNISQKAQPKENNKRKIEDVESTPEVQSKKPKKTFSEQKLAEIHKQKVAHLRRQHHICVNPEDNLPDPIESFDDLVERYGMSEQLRANISYAQPTPVQMQALPALMEKRELLALAPTGSGKTASFVIPLVHHLDQMKEKGLKAVILVPTRELAKQIHREVNILCSGMKVVPHLLGKYDKPPQCDIIISTPNRLVYLLKKETCPYKMAQVGWLVVDECDKFFEVQHDKGFRDQLAAIYKACCGENICRALFSATYMSEVENWSKQYLNSAAVFYIGQKNMAVSTVKQEILFCGQDRGKDLAMEQLIREGYPQPIVVFVNTRERVVRIFKIIRRMEPTTQCLHANMADEQRDHIIDQFAGGHIPILVTTDIFSWGLDFDIPLVINFDVPNSLRAYINRIGRTGRAGKPGRVITYFNEVEFLPMTALAKTIRASGCEVPAFLWNKEKVAALKMSNKFQAKHWKKSQDKGNAPKKKNK